MLTALNSPWLATPAGEELDLVGRAQAGDSEAFGELCRLHGDRLLRQATALCGDATAAEDLVQETLVQGWRSLRRYDGRCRLFTWLCSILIHRHRNATRKRWPLPFTSLLGGAREEAETWLAGAPHPALPPSAQAAQTEQAARLLRSLNKLPAKQREVVYLRFYAQDSLPGIAAALGCSIGTVKSRLANGLERLRKMKSVLERPE